MKKQLHWNFPLVRPHTGMPLGNGLQGLLVRGEGATLRISIGQAGFWDRRGGKPFLPEVDYHRVRALLEEGDEAGLEAAFGGAKGTRQPHQIGGGCLELEAGDGWVLLDGWIDLDEGRITVRWQCGSEERCIRIIQARGAGRSFIHWPEDLLLENISLRPSWDWVGTDPAMAGCEPPRRWQTETEWGFLQKLPEDEALAVIVLRRAEGMALLSGVGVAVEDLREEGSGLGPAAVAAASESFWKEYREAVPRIVLPDPEIQEMVDYALYLQACCTPPDGLPCSLQGPFMEETRLPAWSNDYHFNINVEMIYTPALATNRLGHLNPLWALLRSWMPEMRAAGERFFGAPEALLLPHAVDDRCRVVGTFWTGTIDHACTAWMALLCWNTWRHGGPDSLLGELAWPLLKGAFAGYQAMMEESGDGSLSLPVTVSPEYKGRRMDAWGRNASFQLAAVHAVAGALEKATEVLGAKVDPRWEAVRRRLPRYCEGEAGFEAENPENKKRRIFLWEGEDLGGSHRHHSHLAGITPFKILDPETDPDLVANSLAAWVYRGCGAWSGWSLPWAASLNACCGRPDAALHWLRHWRAVHTNEGRGSLHDAAFPGISILDRANGRERLEREVMQLDGRLGALTAVTDLLIQEFGDELRILPAMPRDWKRLSFEGIRTPGAFLVSGRVENRCLVHLEVRSLKGRFLRLRLPDGNRLARATKVDERINLISGASPVPVP